MTVLRDALSEAQHRLGEMHPDVANYWGTLARTLEELGRREEAREAFETQVSVLMQSLGPESPEALTAQRRLVGMMFADGNYETVLVDFESIAGRLHEAEGEGSIHTLRADLDVIRTLIELERFDEADLSLARVNTLLAEAEGPDVEIAFSVRLLEALSTGRQGSAQRAVEQLRTLLPEALTALHSHAWIIGEIYDVLSRQELAMGDYPAAIRSARQALDHRTSRQQRLEIARSHLLLGNAHFAAGHVPLAREHFSEAVARNRQLLPEDHHLLIESEESLARLGN